MTGLDGEFHQPVLSTKAARSRGDGKARHARSSSFVVLGDPHPDLLPGEDLEHYLWRRGMERDLWGSP